MRKGVENADSFDHFGKVMDVRWRSRSKQYHTDAFYSCCGQAYSSIGVNFGRKCGRSDWNKRTSFHPGNLFKGGSNRSGGGCSPAGSSNDHIPRCNTPTWDCCFRDAADEGCSDVAVEVRCS